MKDDSRNLCCAEKANKSAHGLLRQGCAAALVVGSVACLPTAGAHAESFNLGNGLTLDWALDTSLGTGVRAQSADPKQVSAGNVLPGGGFGRGSAFADNGTLNYAKGDAFSTVLRANAEVALKGDGFGALAQIRAWNDFALRDNNVYLGSTANGYSPNSPLNDDSYDRGSKFSEVRLGEAYVWKDFSFGSTTTRVNLGNEVVKWGTGIFVQGVNKFNAVDVASIRRIGTDLTKEAYVPVPQVSLDTKYGNATFSAFYQFAWEPNIVPGCGTYYSVYNYVNCADSAYLVAPVNIANVRISDPMAYTTNATSAALAAAGQPALSAALANRNFLMQRTADENPDSPQQLGLSMKYKVPQVATEFGAYFVNFSTHAPLIGVRRTPSTSPTTGQSVWDGTLPGALGAQFPAVQAFFDYNVTNIQMFGVSSSTALAGWLIGTEISILHDLPVAYNNSDILLALRGQGPLASKFAATAVGDVFTGYDRKDVAQVTLNARTRFKNLLGAESVSLAGEVAYQHWNGIGDPATSVRYGRNTALGAGSWSGAGGAAIVCPNPALLSDPHCGAEGYATPNAWGLRFASELVYPDVIQGVTLRPRVNVAVDLKGNSADQTFIQGRKTLTVGVRADFFKNYYADASFSVSDRNALADPLHDRAAFLFVVGAKF